MTLATCAFQSALHGCAPIDATPGLQDRFAEPVGLADCIASDGWGIFRTGIPVPPIASRLLTSPHGMHVARSDWSSIPSAPVWQRPSQATPAPAGIPSFPLAPTATFCRTSPKMHRAAKPGLRKTRRASRPPGWLWAASTLRCSPSCRSGMHTCARWVWTDTCSQRTKFTRAIRARARTCVRWKSHPHARRDRPSRPS